MNRNERVENPQETMLVALQGWQADVWTALPGIVQSYDPATKTCTVQPTIQARVTNPDGSKKWISLPVLLDCPVHFPSGGGYTLTFPIVTGDECLVVFSSRCIDAWWQSGKVDIQAQTRMHNLSDGFVFVGISSTPHVPAGMSTGAVQLRNNAGTAYIEISETEVNIVSTSLKHNGVNIGATHTHSGVTTGGSNTGAPI